MDHLEESIKDAIYAHEMDKVRILLTEHPEKISYRAYTGSWLHFAVKCSDYQMVSMLIELGCDVNGKETSGNALDPLFFAKTPEMYELLLSRGADPNYGRHIIGAIAGSNKPSLELVKILEKYGADLHKIFINEQSKKPMNALSTATDWDKQDVVEYLKSKGAVLPPVNELSKETKSPQDEIIAYFEGEYGPVQPRALIEIVPTTDPPITIHIIPAAKDRPFITAFTVGMSDKPMTVPECEEEWQYAEMLIQLPAYWITDELDDPRTAWPFYWMCMIAAYPHANGTWLGGAVTIYANDDPPQPLAPGVPFTSFLLTGDTSMFCGDGREIKFYRMQPLYTEERTLEMREGIGALLDAMAEENLKAIVDLKRKNFGLQKK